MSRLLVRTHKPGKLRRALGRPRRHLRERGGGLQALRPLRRLEHLPYERRGGAEAVRREAVRRFDKAPELPCQSPRLPAGCLPSTVGGKAALGAALDEDRAAPPVVCSPPPVALDVGEAGQVVERLADVGVLGPQRLLLDGEVAPVQRLVLGEAALGLVQQGQVAERGADGGVLGPQRLLGHAEAGAGSRLGANTQDRAAARPQFLLHVGLALDLDFHARIDQSLHFDQRRDREVVAEIRDAARLILVAL